MNTDFSPLSDGTISQPPVPNLASSFLTIWFHPRKTIRKIVDTDAGYAVLPLMILSAEISVLLSWMQTVGPNQSWIILFESMLAALGLSLIILYPGAVITRIICGWFGGQAKTEEIRAVFAWTKIIDFPFSLFFYFMIVSCTCIKALTSIPMLVFLLWGLIISILGLIEVNRLSIGKGFLAWIASRVLFSLPLTILWHYCNVYFGYSK